MMSSSNRWHVHTRTGKGKLTAEQQRQQQKAALLQACKEAKHATLPTFRPGESVCQGCGAVFYCPTCFELHQLPPAKHGYALLCTKHLPAEVHA